MLSLPGVAGKKGKASFATAAVEIRFSSFTWASPGLALSANDFEGCFRERLSKSHSLNHTSQTCQLLCIPNCSLLPLVRHRHPRFLSLPKFLGPFLSPLPSRPPSSFLSASTYAQAALMIKSEKQQVSVLGVFTGTSHLISSSPEPYEAGIVAFIPTLLRLQEVQ